MGEQQEKKRDMVQTDSDKNEDENNYLEPNQTQNDTKTKVIEVVQNKNSLFDVSTDEKCETETMEKDNGVKNTFIISEASYKEKEETVNVSKKEIKEAVKSSKQTDITEKNE